MKKCIQNNGFLLTVLFASLTACSGGGWGTAGADMGADNLDALTDEPVCCALPSEKPMETTAGECVAGGGEILGGPEVCRKVCCTVNRPAGTEVSLTTRAACDKLDAENPLLEVLSDDDMDACAACCADDWTKKKIPLCQKTSAFVQDCDPVCCQVGGGSLKLAPAGKCAQEGGSNQGKPETCTACCADDWTVRLVGDCLEPAAGADLCEPTCCKLGTELDIYLKGDCLEQGNQRGRSRGLSEGLLRRSGRRGGHPQEGRVRCAGGRQPDPCGGGRGRPANLRCLLSRGLDDQERRRVRQDRAAAGSVRPGVLPFLGRHSRAAAARTVPGCQRSRWGEKISECGCREDEECWALDLDTKDCLSWACEDHQCVPAFEGNGKSCWDGDVYSKFQAQIVLATRVSRGLSGRSTCPFEPLNVVVSQDFAI